MIQDGEKRMKNRKIRRTLRKYTAAALCGVLAAALLAGCGKKADTQEGPYAQTQGEEAADTSAEDAAAGKAEDTADETAAAADTAAVQETQEKADEPKADAPKADDPLFVKSEGVMTYGEYTAAPLTGEVVVETFIQAKQALVEGRASLYTQDPDGGYFLYAAPMTQEEYDQLEPGMKIRVSGTKSEYSRETEILDADIEILDGTWLAEPVDVTDLLSSKELIHYQNRLVTFTGMKVEPAAEDSKEAFLYKWDGSGKEGDDLYFNVSADGAVYQFTVETMLCDQTTDIYKAVQNLKIGDVVDMEGYLYWYLGPSPHIISLTVKD